ncbi:6670_t:CDS:1, partial [Cetraspora pellucida]
MDIEKPESQITPVVLITNDNSLQPQTNKPDDRFTLITQRKKKDKKNKKDLATHK